MKNILITLIIVLFISKLAFTSDLNLTAFCKRPLTNELFVCGEFSTVLVVDISNRKSIRTFEITKELKDIQFSADGKTLLAKDLNHVYFINPDSGETIKKIKVSTPRLYPNSPYFADGDWYSKKTVSIYSTKDGNEVFTYDPGFNIANIGFNSDFTELIVTSSKIKIENEQSLIQKKLTKDGGFNMSLDEVITQQNDNKGTKVDVIDLISKKKILTTIIPYTFTTSPISSISKQDSDLYINSSRIFIKVNEKGIASPILDGEYSS